MLMNCGGKNRRTPSSCTCSTLVCVLGVGGEGMDTPCHKLFLPVTVVTERRKRQLRSEEDKAGSPSRKPD